MAEISPVVSLVGLATAPLGRGNLVGPKSISPTDSPAKASTAATAERKARCGALGHMTENASVMTVSVAAMEAFAGESVGEMDLGPTRLPLPKGAVASPTRDTTGEISAMALYAGESVGRVVRIQSAREVVRELADGAELLLHAWHKRT